MPSNYENLGVRNGGAEAGKQRWLRDSRRATATHKIDNAAELPAAFSAWLLSGKTMAEMPGGRAFRRRASASWAYGRFVLRFAFCV